VFGVGLHLGAGIFEIYAIKIPLKCSSHDYVYSTDLFLLD
jgi:predicted nucleic acid binding AN1-type Zn finger protein